MVDTSQYEHRLLIYLEKYVDSDKLKKYSHIDLMTNILRIVALNLSDRFNMKAGLDPEAERDAFERVLENYLAHHQIYPVPKL